MLHISASLSNSNTDYDLGEIDVDLPINSNQRSRETDAPSSYPRSTVQSFTRRLTNGVNAFIDAFNA